MWQRRALHEMTGLGKLHMDRLRRLELEIRKELNPTSDERVHKAVEN